MVRVSSEKVYMIREGDREGGEAETARKTTAGGAPGGAPGGDPSAEGRARNWWRWVVPDWTRETLWREPEGVWRRTTLLTLLEGATLLSESAALSEEGAGVVMCLRVKAVPSTLEWSS